MRVRVHNFDIAFLTIVITAFLLRIWGIWNVTTTDEYNEVIEALRVCSGHLNYERWFKRCYLYILAVEYGVYYVIGWLLSVFSNPMDFAEKVVRNMESLFIIGRVTSAAAGVMTIGLLFRIGEKFLNRRIGLIASLLLTFTVFHVYMSQQVKVDALLGLLVVASFYFIIKMFCEKRADLWDLTLCGLLIGLAVQTKINSVALVVPLLVAVFYGQASILRVNKQLMKAFVPGFMIGFILGNPPVVIAPQKFIASILGLGKVYSTPVNQNVDDIIGFLAYPLYFYRSMGPIVSILAILGLGHAFLNPNRVRAALLLFIILFYVGMGFSRFLVADYYIIPIVPLLYLLVADFLHNVLLKIEAVKPSTMRFVYGLSLVLMLSWPLNSTILHAVSLSGKNTRFLAKDWIEVNIPYGSKILMDSGKSINSFAPPIAENRISMERILSQARENVEKGNIVHGMVDANALVYYELLMKTVPEASYDITSTMFGLDVQPIDYYMVNGYQYFVISMGMKQERSSKGIAQRNPEVAQFYSSLDTDSRLKLIKTIEPTSRNKGDTFYIYEVVE